MKNHAANKLINDVQGFEPKTLLIQELLIINILCVWGVCTCVCGPLYRYLHTGVLFHLLG